VRDLPPTDVLVAVLRPVPRVARVPDARRLAGGGAVVTNIATEMFNAVIDNAIEQTETGCNLPRRRGKSGKTLALEAALVRIVSERAPITVRGVCYALFAEGLIDSMATKETGRISRVMTEMRETDALDWTLIVDGSRVVGRVSQWSDPNQFFREAVRQYRRDNWQEQPVYVEVWSEKSTVQGVLAPVLNEYGITFRVMKGFGSFTAVRQAAEDSLAIADGKHGVALYIGDWDPSGLYMSEVDLPDRLERYGSSWEFERIALMRADLAVLPYFDTDTKMGDARADWYVRNTTADPSRCWELDAMDPNDLRGRVEQAIVERMDMDGWQRALEVEAVERESMQDFMKAWQSTKSARRSS
jgi:hypothetical protein